MNRVFSKTLALFVGLVASQFAVGGEAAQGNFVCLTSFVSSNARIPNFSLSQNRQYFFEEKAAILATDPQGGNLTQYALSEDAINFLSQPFLVTRPITPDGAGIFATHDELSRFGNGSNLSLRFLDPDLHQAFPDAFGELVFSCYKSQNQ